MATKVPTTVPKNSPYYYSGNVAPVQKVTVPKPPPVVKAPVQTRPLYGVSTAENAIANQKYLADNFGYVSDVPGTVDNPSQSFNDFWQTPAISAWGSPEDFRNAITSQYDYTDLVGKQHNAEIADAASQRSQIGRLLGDWGGDLSGLVGEGLIDQDTAGAAAANPTSFMSQLTQALNQGQAKDVLSLGSRGALDSGAYGISQARRLRDFQNASATGLTNLRSNIANVRSGMSTRADDRATALRNLESDIATRLGQDPAYQKRDAIPAETAHWDGTAYVTESGRRFDINGNPV